MAARWQGGRITMGPAGRDRRVRARISKRRTPGQRNERFEDDAESNEEIQESSLPDVRPVEPYTSQRQVSPERKKRGRVRAAGRTRLDSRLSLAKILTMSLCALANLLISLGFLQDTPSLGSCKCDGDKKVPSWKLQERKEHCFWRCSKCRKTLSVTSRDSDMFDARVGLKSIAGALWIYSSSLHLSADQASLLLGVGNRAIRSMFDKFSEYFLPLINRLNDNLIIGWQGADVELDEISFRSVGRRHAVVWLQYLAVVRRGSGLIWIQRLPYRISRAEQGGGGPISIEEMEKALLLCSDEPVLAKGCVCHTDGAKAYRNLAAPLYDGSLLAYEHLKLGHTSVKTQTSNSGIR